MPNTPSLLPMLDAETPEASTLAHDRIRERNRRNAQASTGPRTPGGKRRASRNSLRHGLTANPAAGVVEDAERFQELYDALLERLAPGDPVEVGLVHRVTVCLWRLQRAAIADGAITGLATRSVTPHREHVQQWIEDIHEAWRPEVVQVPSGCEAMPRDATGKTAKMLRPRLAGLDRVLADEMMRSSAAMTAMEVMLGDLETQLETQPRLFRPEQSEQLAWLLGESAHRLPRDQAEVDHPDAMPRARAIDRMIGEARLRPPDTPLPPALKSVIDGRRDTLRQQARIVDGDDPSAESLEQTAALLPDAETLDRLLRYERHAERGLIGALRTLAQYRGQPLHAAMTSIQLSSADGHEMHVQQVLPW